jgi:hypothetical protein
VNEFQVSTVTIQELDVRINPSETNAGRVWAASAPSALANVRQLTMAGTEACDVVESRWRTSVMRSEWRAPIESIRRVVQCPERSRMRRRRNCS